jgi:hypothetical protein
MCDKCRVISWEIAGYERQRTKTDDPLALSLIAEAIADLKAEKAALHPDEQDGASP